jgi:hypothetical protein
VKARFQSNRHFKVWRYLISHGQLLLRSVPTDSESLRIEVLFKGVYAMKLTTAFDHFAIRDPTDEELSQISHDIGTPVTDLGLLAFMVESSSSKGYVVASEFHSAEDDGDYKSPSSLYIGP